MSKFYYVFLYFIIYSILGWICEVIYCYILDRKLTNRGFLEGPYCPIYGIGGLIVVYFLLPVKSIPFLVFLLGMILASILEYITSFIMEKLFDTRWWDYSNNKFNINGRVCLLNSFLFGVLSLFAMYFIHPLVIDIIELLQVNIIPIISTVLLVLFTADLIKTLLIMVNLKQRLLKLKELKEELDMKLTDLTKNDYTHVITEMLDRQIHDLIAEKRYFENRLINSFKHIKSNKFSEQITKIKEEIQNVKNERKQLKRIKKGV